MCEGREASELGARPGVNVASRRAGQKKLWPRVRGKKEEEGERFVRANGEGQKKKSAAGELAPWPEAPGARGGRSV